MSLYGDWYTCREASEVQDRVLGGDVDLREINMQLESEITTCGCEITMCE